MECKLKRLLIDDEEIHHKNTIEFDDRTENYEIRKKGEHVSEHNTKLPKFFRCQCGNYFQLSGTKLSRMKSERKRFPTMTGPFCSRRCAGIYGSNE